LLTGINRAGILKKFLVLVVDFEKTAVQSSDTCTTVKTATNEAAKVSN